MVSKEFSILDLLDLDLKEHDSLDLVCVSGRRGLKRILTIPDVNRPGLALSGFFESFAHERIQLFGRGEYAYLTKILKENNLKPLERIFAYEIPCCIFSRDIDPPKEIIEIANKYNCPILKTSLPSSEFTVRILRVLSNIFAPTVSIHGVFVDVYGLGILILGDSGVGKSETALELIERGHRLVADDVVVISCLNGNSLMGQGTNKIIGYHMEIRGLGIINITQLYGIRSIRDKKGVQLVAKLEEWDAQKAYDRVGTNELTMEILDVKIPLLEIPVKPGRNIPIILETAAMNERLKTMGYFSAKEFNKNVLRSIETDTSRALYYNEDDE